MIVNATDLDSQREALRAILDAQDFDTITQKRLLYGLYGFLGSIQEVAVNTGKDVVLEMENSIDSVTFVPIATIYKDGGFNIDFGSSFQSFTDKDGEELDDNLEMPDWAETRISEVERLVAIAAAKADKSK